MLNNWMETTWGNISTLEYGKRLKDYKNSTGKYPVFGTNGQIGWTDSPLSDRAGVIIGRKGAYREVHYSSKPFFVIDTAFYLNPNLDVVDPHWAYYELLTHDINKMDSGSAIPSTSRHDFYNLKVLLPPLETQKKHISILRSLDDKIDVNNSINSTLEELGTTLFIRWFVDFEFPNENGEPYRSSGGAMKDSELGQIPQDWSVSTIGSNLITVLGGTPDRTKKELWDRGTIPWINSGKINEFRIIKPTEYITKEGLEKSATKMLPKGTTVLAITGATLGKVSYLEIDSCANQSVVGILESEEISSEYIYIFLD